MHRILFTVIHSQMQWLPMTALKGNIMIDCVRGGDRGGTRLQVYHGLKEEETCTIQETVKGKRLSSADERQG